MYGVALPTKNSTCCIEDLVLNVRPGLVHVHVVFCRVRVVTLLEAVAGLIDGYIAETLHLCGHHTRYGVGALIAFLKVKIPPSWSENKIKLYSRKFKNQYKFLSFW